MLLTVAEHVSRQRLDEVAIVFLRMTQTLLQSHAPRFVRSSSSLSLLHSKASPSMSWKSSLILCLVLSVLSNGDFGEQGASIQSRQCSCQDFDAVGYSKTGLGGAIRSIRSTALDCFVYQTSGCWLWVLSHGCFRCCWTAINRRPLVRTRVVRLDR
ncbi:hypothetical protein BKA80DRAFT_35459 [Phyllosticta citrichinensis]